MSDVKKCIYAVLSIWAAIFIAWVGNSLGLDKNNWSGWVQAIGSIGAILVAVYVSDRQHKQSIERANNEERDRKDALCNAIISVMRQCYAHIAGIPGVNSQHEDMEMYLKVVPKAHYENLERLLREVPLYEVSDKQVVRSALDMMAVMDKARRLLETVAAADPQERKAGWPYYSRNVEDVRRSALEIASRFDEKKDS